MPKYNFKFGYQPGINVTIDELITKLIQKIYGKKEVSAEEIALLCDNIDDENFLKNERKDIFSNPATEKDRTTLAFYCKEIGNFSGKEITVNHENIEKYPYLEDVQKEKELENTKLVQKWVFESVNNVHKKDFNKEAREEYAKKLLELASKIERILQQDNGATDADLQEVKEFAKNEFGINDLFPGTCHISLKKAWVLRRSAEILKKSNETQTSYDDMLKFLTSGVREYFIQMPETEKIVTGKKTGINASKFVNIYYKNMSDGKSSLFKILDNKELLSKIIDGDLLKQLKEKATINSSDPRDEQAFSVLVAGALLQSGMKYDEIKNISAADSKRVNAILQKSLQEDAWPFGVLIQTFEGAYDYIKNNSFDKMCEDYEPSIYLTSGAYFLLEDTYLSKRQKEYTAKLKSIKKTQNAIDEYFDKIRTLDLYGEYRLSLDSDVSSIMKLNGNSADSMIVNTISWLILSKFYYEKTPIITKQLMAIKCFANKDNVAVNNPIASLYKNLNPEKKDAFIKFIKKEFLEKDLLEKVSFEGDDMFNPKVSWHITEDELGMKFYEEYCSEHDVKNIFGFQQGTTVYSDKDIISAMICSVLNKKASEITSDEVKKFDKLLLLNSDIYNVYKSFWKEYRNEDYQELDNSLSQLAEIDKEIKAEMKARNSDETKLFALNDKRKRAEEQFYSKFPIAKDLKILKTKIDNLRYDALQNTYNIDDLDEKFRGYIDFAGAKGEKMKANGNSFVEAIFNSKKTDDKDRSKKALEDYAQKLFELAAMEEALIDKYKDVSGKYVYESKDYEEILSYCKQNFKDGSIICSNGNMTRIHIDAIKKCANYLKNPTPLKDEELSLLCREANYCGLAIDNEMLQMRGPFTPLKKGTVSKLLSVASQLSEASDSFKLATMSSNTDILEILLERDVYNTLIDKYYKIDSTIRKKDDLKFFVAHTLMQNGFSFEELDQLTGKDRKNVSEIIRKSMEDKNWPCNIMANAYISLYDYFQSGNDIELIEENPKKYLYMTRAIGGLMGDTAEATLTVPYNRYLDSLDNESKDKISKGILKAKEWMDKLEVRSDFSNSDTLRNSLKLNLLTNYFAENNYIISSSAGMRNSYFMTLDLLESKDPYVELMKKYEVDSSLRNAFTEFVKKEYDANKIIGNYSAYMDKSGIPKFKCNIDMDKIEAEFIKTQEYKLASLNVAQKIIEKDNFFRSGEYRKVVKYVKTFEEARKRNENNIDFQTCAKLEVALSKYIDKIKKENKVNSKGEFIGSDNNAKIRYRYCVYMLKNVQAFETKIAAKAANVKNISGIKVFNQMLKNANVKARVTPKNKYIIDCYRRISQKLMEAPEIDIKTINRDDLSKELGVRIGIVNNYFKNHNFLENINDNNLYIKKLKMLENMYSKENIKNLMNYQPVCPTSHYSSLAGRALYQQSKLDRKSLIKEDLKELKDVNEQFKKAYTNIKISFPIKKNENPYKNKAEQLSLCKDISALSNVVGDIIRRSDINKNGANPYIFKEDNSMPIELNNKYQSLILLMKIDAAKKIMPNKNSYLSNKLESVSGELKMAIENLRNLSYFRYKSEIVDKYDEEFKKNFNESIKYRDYLSNPIESSRPKNNGTGKITDRHNGNFMKDSSHIMKEK